MGKEEIARYEQFLLFPQCFQKACFPGASKGVIVWEWDRQSGFACIIMHDMMVLATFITVSRFALQTRKKKIIFKRAIKLSI